MFLLFKGSRVLKGCGINIQYCQFNLNQTQRLGHLILSVIPQEKSNNQCKRGGHFACLLPGKFL